MPQRRLADWARTAVCSAVAALLLISAAAYSQTSKSGSAPENGERGSQVSDGDKIKFSAQAIRRMRDVLVEVFAKLKEARDHNDVVRAACVNESLTQIKALLRIAEQSDVSMQDAIAKRNNSLAEDEYLKLNIAPRKVDELRAKAEECMGQLAFQTVGLTVEVEEPKNLPGDDLANPPPPPPVLTRPPPASPTL